MRFLIFSLVLFLFSPWALADGCEGFLQEQLVVQEIWSDELDKTWNSQKEHFSRSEVRLWTEALDHLKGDLKAIKDKSSVKDQLLKEEYLKVLGKMDQIHDAFLKIKSEKKKAKYFSQIFSAIWATMTVHSHEVLETRSKAKDYQRYFTILKSISDFDKEKPEFSFYKIKRAIEGRFSLTEYIRCKL